MSFRRHEHVDKITVFVDSDFAGDPVSRTGLVAQISNHTVKSGSTLHAVVKGGQVELSLRSMYQDLGLPMKIEIQSDIQLRIH